MTDNKPSIRFYGPPFQDIEDTVKTTGLSAYFLRQGIRDGTIPYIKTGVKYMVNVVRLLEKLNALPAERW